MVARLQLAAATAASPPGSVPSPATSVGEGFPRAASTLEAQAPLQQPTPKDQSSEPRPDPPPSSIEHQNPNPQTPFPDLRALTRAIRRGDLEAFSRFYDLYSFRIYKFLLVLTRGEEHDAKEVCQAVLLKLTKGCKVFDDERQLWAWLATLAKNAFIDHCRARQRHCRLVSLEDLPPLPAGEPAEEQLAEFLRESLAALRPDERELLQAAYIDECPLQALANQSGQTYKAVESRLARLRHKLKELLLKKLRDENQP
jgi:RNA polymerase sigma-70 factor, ECF subfamily